MAESVFATLGRALKRCLNCRAHRCANFEGNGNDGRFDGQRQSSTFSTIHEEMF